MTFDAFPAELRARRQWVLWRYETRDGKRTKVPYQASGARASSTDPATWATYEAACTALEIGGPRGLTFSGVGFVFSPDDGVCGVDLDHVVNPATGEMDDAALSLIEALNSYAEYSPSGTGAHAIVRATLPAGAVHKRKGIECYEAGRYFTVTGRLFRNAPETVTDWDGAQLQRLLFPDVLPEQPRIAFRPARFLPRDDRELVDEAMSARNGPAFRDLWRGGFGKHATHSEADSALCFHLAFWTNRDPVRMNALFRQSGLMREKWDRLISKSSQETYGELTIRKACERTGEGYAPTRRAG